MKLAFFHLSFFPKLSCLEISYKKTTTILGIIDIRIKTTDSFAAAKICKNCRYKVFDQWVKSYFSKFLGVMSDISLIR